MRNQYLSFVLAMILIRCSVIMGQQDSNDFSYDSYAVVLRTFVDDRGMVNYDMLKVRPEDLRRFTVDIGRFDRNIYLEWDEKKQLAFWLNAYNAFTLKAVSENHPVRTYRSRFYPRDSIRQIKGVWDRMRFKVMGNTFTLRHIEDKILRGKFDEPLIHMAIVNGSVGAAVLRREPYVGEKLNAQFDGQAEKFMADKNKFKIDRQNGIVYLSMILKWFDGDFLEKYRLGERIGRFNVEQTAILNFVSEYVSAGDKAYLLRGDYRIAYLDYDWSLNEQR